MCPNGGHGARRVHPSRGDFTRRSSKRAARSSPTRFYFFQLGNGGGKGYFKGSKASFPWWFPQKWVFALGIARPSDHLTWSGLWWRINGVTDKVLMTYFASTSGRYGSRPAGLQAQRRQNGCILAGGWGASDRLISAQFCPQASKQYPSAPARW